jgi:hypothetical protein
VFIPILKRDTSSIELRRVTSLGSKTGAIGGGGPTLRVVRTLSLPTFHLNHRIYMAYMKMDRHRERRPNLEVSPPQERSKNTKGTATPRVRVHDFHSMEHPRLLSSASRPLRLRGLHMTWKKVATTVSHRAIFYARLQARRREQL